MLGADQRRHRAALLSLAVGGGRRYGSVEDAPFHRAARMRAHRRSVIDLLEHPRHGEDERGLEAAEIGDERSHVWAMGKLRTRHYGPNLDDPGEDVGKREE